jgi:hypothetical protein
MTKITETYIDNLIDGLDTHEEYKKLIFDERTKFITGHRLKAEGIVRDSKSNLIIDNRPYYFRINEKTTLPLIVLVPYPLFKEEIRSLPDSLTPSPNYTTCSDTVVPIGPCLPEHTSKRGRKPKKK